MGPGVCRTVERWTDEWSEWTNFNIIGLALKLNDLQREKFTFVERAGSEVASAAGNLQE